jgi:hypothetical protein
MPPITGWYVDLYKRNIAQDQSRKYSYYWEDSDKLYEAHPDIRATYMSIMNVARMSLASALGGIMGSWMIARWGSPFLMQFCGFGLISLIFYFAFLVGWRRRQGKQA